MKLIKGSNKNRDFPVIKEWFDTLSSDNRNKAKKLFGKINQITNDNPEQKRILFQQGVIAFEFYRHKDELSKLEETTEGNLESLLKVFTSLDNLEASLYHKIVKQRVEVIHKLEQIINKNELEKTVQRFLFDHLWLLDPSWERVTGTAEIEKSFRDALEEANLSIEEKIGRVDIQYRITSGVHVIIELKRPDVSVSIHDLIKQVNKYKRALKKNKVVSNDDAVVKVVCVLGVNPPELNEPDQKETALKTLEVNGVQLLFYKNLITNAKNSYREYITQQGELNKIQSILEQIDSTSFV